MSYAPVNITDLFCGLGGASAAAGLVVESRGGRIGEHLALNHWEPALRTHRANHPDALHLQEDIRRVNPLDYVKPGSLDILLAGPDCTHHSRARGGKPRSTRQRALAWDVIRWVRLTYPKSVVVENVPEFLSWGPVDDDGQVITSRRGEYFEEFLAAFRRLGYQVEYRILCAAHYGDRTTRRRFFLQARRGDCGPITWPTPSYRLERDGAEFDGLPLARPAREIIDWNLQGESIWNRKRALAPATMARIMEGLKRFASRPFIVPQLSGARVRGIDEPLNTITATGTGNALIEPYIINIAQRNSWSSHVRSTDTPLSTVCAKAELALVEPYLLGIGGPRGRQVAGSLDNPLGTVIGRNHTYLVEPFLLRYNDERRAQDLSEPVTTIDGSNRLALVEPFLIPNFGEREGQKPRTHALSDPLPAVTSHGAGALIEPFVMSYYGNGGSHSLSESLPTMTGKDRFALIEALYQAQEQGIPVIWDIRLRMLQPHELAAAHSFPASYQILGTKEQKVRMIGNSWPVATASALVKEALQWN